MLIYCFSLAYTIIFNGLFSFYLGTQCTRKLNSIACHNQWSCVHWQHMELVHAHACIDHFCVHTYKLAGDGWHACMVVGLVVYVWLEREEFVTVYVLFAPRSNLGRCGLCVVTQLPINCRQCIRIGIWNKQQWAQEVLTINTRSMTVHRNCRMIQIWWCKSRPMSNWLSPLMAKIKVGPVSICRWCKPKDDYQTVSNWRMCWALNNDHA